MYKLINVQFAKGALDAEKCFGINGLSASQFLICTIYRILLEEVRIVQQLLRPDIDNILYIAIGAAVFNGQAFLGHVLIKCIQFRVYMELRRIYTYIDGNNHSICY